ncbi:MAG: hypothetical protein K2L96_08130 [Muribaculaceae bacterium]|nr:hypothetical protein [Muribaculaceae bacterium]
MRKASWTYTLIAIAAMATSCRGDHSSAAMKAAAEAGHRDALEVMALKPESMEREGGVLAIRARETELRDQGFDSCAAAYSRAAYNVIDSVLNAENALR